MKPTFSQLSKLIHFERHSLRLSEGEVTEQLLHKSGGAFFLGHYSLKDIRDVLKRMNVMKAVGAQGFQNVTVSLDTEDPYHHKITLHGEQERQGHLLGEIRISEGVFRPKSHFVQENRLDEMDMIIIEWMCLQNPVKDFTQERPRFPGQKHPGLGVARKVLAVLTEIALGLNKDGILNFPEYYHNAAIYTRPFTGERRGSESFDGQHLVAPSGSGRLSQTFLFYNPEMQGMLLAMIRDLGAHPLHEVSQAILDGKLMEKNTRTKQEWAPEEQILPVSQRTLDYFSSDTYLRLCQTACRTHSYAIVEWAA